MSWIAHPEEHNGGPARQRRSPQAPQRNDDGSAKTGQGDEEPPRAHAGEDEVPLVPDPSNPDRLVPAKAANRPYLGYTEYRKKREKAHAEWKQRQEDRAEKKARGESVGPDEPDPTEEPEVGCWGLFKFFFWTVVVIVLAGKFITGSYLWEHELPNWRKLIPTNQRLFSERMLATFDGSDAAKPVYLAIDGDVFDVTSNRPTYGPGGPYHMLAGKDAARAYGTGCFSTHLTHDLRGLSESELKGVENWKAFYARHKQYVKVGRVSHPPIDPGSPVPEHCDPKKAKASRSPDQVQVERVKQRTRVGKGKGQTRDGL